MSLTSSLAAGRATARAPRRAPFVAALALLLTIGLLTNAKPAHGQLPDAVPTWWHEAAGLTPLLTAPPPENPATICIIDTGVTPTPDLDITARWAYDGGTLDDIRETEDSPGHGTLVAHFAAAAVNGWGGAGAFPHARISSVRVFPREGGASWQDYIRAITRCLKLDAATKVIVISLGGQTIEAGEADELAHWITRARDRHDVNVVAAAGNTSDVAAFPGRFDSALTVAGHDGESLCPFSARGSGVDIAAPGCPLRQGGPSGALWDLQGTSFSAPIVAGALAALRSYAPGLSAREAEAWLIGSARAGDPPRVDLREPLERLGIVSLEQAPETTISLPPGDTSRLGGRTGAEEARRSPEPPRLRVRRRRRGVLLVVRNGNDGAYVECRLRGRHIRSRRRRFRLRHAAGVGRCRFVGGLGPSPWTAVRW
ncbi:MAG TPA: S8/S53 family peptidase [Solirubrobacteraceae bacterium]